MNCIFMSLLSAAAHIVGKEAYGRTYYAFARHEAIDTIEILH
jgi:hypothetical protein